MYRFESPIEIYLYYTHAIHLQYSIHLQYFLMYLVPMKYCQKFWSVAADLVIVDHEISSCMSIVTSIVFRWLIIDSFNGNRKNILLSWKKVISESKWYWLNLFPAVRHALMQWTHLTFGRFYAIICSWPTNISNDRTFLPDFLVILKRTLQNY